MTQRGVLQCLQVKSSDSAIPAVQTATITPKAMIESENSLK